MASRRGTNNSAVVSLEQQSAVIADMSTQGGLGAELGSMQVTISEPKVQKKKKKEKAKSSASKAPEIQAPQSAGLGVTQPRQVVTSPLFRAGRRVAVTASRGDVLSNVTQSEDTAAAASHGNPLSNATQSGDTAGPEGQGHDPVDVQDGGPLAAGDSSEALGEPGEQEVEDLQAQQQQWFWQQWQQFNQANPRPPMNPTFSQYGNFVPNYQFGLLPQGHFWQEEEAEEASEEAEAQPRVRQATHEVSDEEEEVVEVLPQAQVPAQAQAQAAQAGPTQGMVESQTEKKLKEQLNLVKEADRVSPRADPEVAQLLERYIKDAAAIAEMEKLTKLYPRVANVECMRVQRLDNEVYQAVEQHVRNMDQNLQGIQKAMLGAMTAITPLLDLVFKRKANDPELDEPGGNVMDSLKLMAFANSAIAGKRRELLKPNIAPIYARTLAKGQEESSEWLLGGDLVELTKKCEVSKRIAEKVVKRKPQVQPRNRVPPFKKFRAPFPANFGPRVFNPFQMNQIRFPAPMGFPQMLPQQQQFTPQMGGTYNNFPRRYRNPRPRQGFPKRGGYNK